jgi:hypothetical protein
MSDTPTPPRIAEAEQIFGEVLDRHENNYVDALRDLALQLAAAREDLRSIKQGENNGNDV